MINLFEFDFVINLQLFAEEKTESATPKRRREAREKGQVAKSRELT
ncbi:MAG: FlhB HrpN YscU SpaS Family, partial [Clostridia bacterium]|nr:FlhB HrpN YscU SpaS Family [Clostridia bacterium]